MQLGGRISDIGHAIQEHVEAHGFSVVREFVGHGIGAALHEEPQIANYGEPGRGPRLAEGMMLAIEPMVNMGRPAVKVLADGWTAVTKDGSLSAHFEHTVAVTKNGPLVLTRRTAPAEVARRPSRWCPALAGPEGFRWRPALAGPGGWTMFEKDPREEDRRATAVEGIVREALPYAQYRVEIDGQRQIVAHAPGGAGTELHPGADRRSGAAGALAAGRDAGQDRRED